MLWSTIQRLEDIVSATLPLDGIPLTWRDEKSVGLAQIPLPAMMATYSPHREDREAVHHHSPKAISHFDAIREIRRSLSRSPSKTSDLRQYPFRSPGPSNLPFSPSPLSPSRKSTSESLSQLASIMSPHSSRTSQTPRFQRPILRRSTQTHGLNRVRTSPKSPSKRVLADSSDGGNSSPQPLRKRNSTEADRELALKCLTGEVTENDARQHEEPLTWKTAQTRQEKRRSGGALMSTIAPLSPMKRTEGPRSDDNQPFESSAKRRSLHGPGLDFSIFESDDLDGGMFMDKRSQDDNDCFSSNGSIPSTRFSTIPKRSSSLRKSTLQQRQLDRPSNLKFNHVMDLDKSWLESSTPSTSTKRGFRISLDNHLEPLRRESPFSSQGSLPNASIHPATSTLGSTSSQQLSRHPLSRALTQSSSFTGDEDDSPTHEPVHRPTRPRSHDFSKSLPIGSSRPVPSPENHDFSSQSSFATPGNYRAAKPLPAAFMSTGLISKKNRNVEDPNAGLPKAHMPDTPCKKQSVIYQADEKFAAPKPAAHRASRPSFGQPSTPLDAQYNQPKISVFPFARSAGIFGTRSSKHNLLRKTSFASIESDEKAGSRSPLTRANSQSTDSDYPPTPTKHLPDEQNRNSISPSPHHAGGLTATHHAPSSGFGARLTNSKLSPISASPKGVDGDSDSMMEDSPSANLRPVSVPKDISLSDSYTRARMSKNLNFPTPLARKDPSLSTFHSPALDRAKISVPSVSPRATPHTPLEGFFPPDPSGLSISGRAERPRNPSNTGKGPIVPATPTGPREYFSNFSNRPSLNLAAVDGSNLDISLTSRFEKVDLIGSGEFSQVFRVSQPPEASPFHKIYSVSSSRPSSRGSIPEKVWAVKKSRYPYSGAKDRQRKIQEVDVLKALGHSDHIVTFVDSWEEQGHLYIQTEFCEEGTLDVFLAQMGLKARLDDFRIWKILLELSVVSEAS